MDPFTLTRRTTQCSHCSRPTTATCARCDLSPPITLDAQPTTTYYCSSACQAAAWPTHKDVCKALQARRSLYRAADTIQKAFLIYREKVFERLFTKVHEKDGILYLTESPSIDVLEPFPEELVKNRRDREAVLTHLASMDALGWMNNLIKIMLEGFDAHLEENTIKLKTPYRSTKVVGIDGGSRDVDSTTLHHLKIILPSGEIFALDIASAQHGFHNPLVPWIDFYRLRVEAFQNRQHFGSARACFEEYWEKGGGTDNQDNGKVKRLGLIAATLDYNRKFETVLDKAVKEWLHGEYRRESFSKMLRLPANVFDKKQEELLGFVEYNLQRLKDMLIDMGFLGTGLRKSNQLPFAKRAEDPIKKVEPEISETRESANELLRAVAGGSGDVQTAVRDTKVVDTKERQTKARQTKARQTKARQTKVQQTKAQQIKAQQIKAQQIKAQQTKERQTKARQTKARQTKTKSRKNKSHEHRAEIPEPTEMNSQGLKTQKNKKGKAKAEETNTKETKAKKIKAQDTKAQDTKAQDTKAQETKTQETKIQETKIQETKPQETQADTIKAKNPETQDSKLEIAQSQWAQAEEDLISQLQAFNFTLNPETQPFGF